MASIMLAWISRRSHECRVPDPAPMKLRPFCRERLGSPAFAVVLAFLLAWPLDGAYAQDDDAGHFEYRVSTDARAALESGLTLTIRLEIEILNRRTLWVDTEIAALTQLYALEYHALTERYIVRNLNSGDQASFATLFAALNFLGRIDKLPIIDAGLLEPERSYDIRVRALLDTEQLPGPLRLLAFWRRDWSLGSEWYRWRLAGD